MVACVNNITIVLQALGLLFDPEHSQVKLLSIAVTGPSTIAASWTLGGYLRFPWRPRVKEFQGDQCFCSATYFIDCHPKACDSTKGDKFASKNLSVSKPPTVPPTRCLLLLVSG